MDNLPNLALITSSFPLAYVWPDYNVLFRKHLGIPLSRAPNNSIPCPCLAAGAGGGEKRVERDTVQLFIVTIKDPLLLDFSCSKYALLHNMYRPFIQNMLVSKTQEGISSALNSKGSEIEAV